MVGIPLFLFVQLSERSPSVISLKWRGGTVRSGFNRKP